MSGATHRRVGAASDACPAGAYGSSARQNIWHKEEGEAKDHIDRQKLNTFQPVRSSVIRYLAADQHRQQHDKDKPCRKCQVHRRGAKDKADEHQHWCNEDGHLHTGAIAIESDRSMRFFIATLIAVACSAALPRIATTNRPMKPLLAKRTGCRLDRAHKNLAHPCDHRSRGAQQPARRDALTKGESAPPPPTHGNP